MMRTLWVLLDKEFRQMLRNPFIPRMLVAFPVMVMLLMPWVATMDVRHIEVSVVDNDRSTASRRMVEKLGASAYFTLYEQATDYPAALFSLERGDADVIVEIPRDFERDLAAAYPQRVRISANGVNALKGSLGTQYVTQVVVRTLTELHDETGAPLTSELISVQNRYNPTLDYRHFMIPALMIILLILICGFMPALNLVGEKETGTIEQINVTPVNRFTFTLAKLIPYGLVGFLVLAISMLIAWGMYGLLPAGSLGAILLASALFILTMSGIGVICANYSSTMQQTMFVVFFFMMVFMLMSGLLTPVASMPRWAQIITHCVPPCYFVDIMRAVYLKAATIAELGTDYLALAGFAVLFDVWAALSYRKRA